MERTIIPFISKIASFISRSAIYYISHAIVLFLLLVCARIFELIYDWVLHGIPKLLGQVITTGLAKDFVFFLQVGAWGYLLFALLYLIHKKAAHLFFIIAAVLLLLIQVSLSQYFINTLVPLGADLWGYSMADIKQTVGASGGIKLPVMIALGGFLVLVIGSLIFLPKRIKLSGWVAFFFLVLFSLASFTKGPSLVNEWMPGQEYSNNLSLNKSWFFFNASYLHFFPVKEEQDIYSNNYSGDYSTSAEDASLSQYRYVDEKNYPFLQKIDTAKDVLSPFFTKSAQRPNIVIVLVEGLGRAFTNKGAYLGNFTPFIDSLSDKSLYWENFLSEGGRTFAALPSILSSLPFAKNGFNELGENMPKHLSILNLLKKNGYNTSFYYGGDSHFDNMDLFLKKNTISSLNDEKTFPAGYSKMPAQNGFTWGYGDKELFRRYFETKNNAAQPYLSVVLTVSTHNPFLINEQDVYLQKFENRMTQLGFSDDIKKQDRNYDKQYASILYTDDAVRNFINEYKKRPDFANTVFLITGDHRMPEIPMSTKIDRYHVPLIIYSPLLKRTAKFSSVSTHFDITPSLLAWLKKSYQLQLPDTVSWIGSGLDTNRQFRNIHAYPIMQTKTDLIDFVMGSYLLNGNDLFKINSNMDLSPEKNPTKVSELKAAFNRFKNKNDVFLQTMKMVPDSLLKKYTPN
jgi:phosphoglycerol transferase MdoB-like AlkP superfamily enzyme